MRVALLQLNATLAQPEINGKSIEAAYKEAVRLGADLAVAPEMAVPGYIPGEMLFDSSLMQAIEIENERLRTISVSVPLVFGTCSRVESGNLWNEPWNELWWCANGKATAKIRKRTLQNFCFLEDSEDFEPDAVQRTLIEYSGKRIGFIIGENSQDSFCRLVNEGATLIINPTASTCALGSYVPKGRKPGWALPSKSIQRKDLLSGLSRDSGVPIVYVNRVGADSGSLYDGESCLILPDGTIQCAEAFDEYVFTVDTDKRGSSGLDVPKDEGTWLHKALVVGTADNLRKMGIKSLVIGLSGGIDSSVVASIATKAIGHEKITGVSLPTRFTSEDSLRLARLQARLLDIHYMEIDADAPFEGATASLRRAIPGRGFSLTDENIQSRCRGMLLMALTSEPTLHRRLGTDRCAVINSGNKSEVATGYFTMYGDGIGAFSPIGDLFKMRVYALAREMSDRIPEEIIKRPPTAELRPNQTDESSLMPYRQLDAILGALLEANRPEENLHDDLAEVLEGQDLVDARMALSRVLKLKKNSEFKRKQLPFALNVTHNAFGAARKCLLPV